MENMHYHHNRYMMHFRHASPSPLSLSLPLVTCHSVLPQLEAPREHLREPGLEAA